jgi:hypothetical protein
MDARNLQAAIRDPGVSRVVGLQSVEAGNRLRGGVAGILAIHAPEFFQVLAASDVAKPGRLECPSARVVAGPESAAMWRAPHGSRFGSLRQCREGRASKRELEIRGRPAFGHSHPQIGSDGRSAAQGFETAAVRNGTLAHQPWQRGLEAPFALRFSLAPGACRFRFHAWPAFAAPGIWRLSVGDGQPCGVGWTMSERRATSCSWARS